MKIEPLDPPTGILPRRIAEDLLWAGGSMSVTFKGKTVYGHFSCFLIKGSEKTLLVDSGHPMHWETLEGEIESFLDGRPLDYLFSTHCEFPHAGLLPNWLEKYPEAIAIGNVGDDRLYYPGLADRIRPTAPGDRIDLGDREFVVLPAIWKDLNNTQWGFDTKSRTLYVSDGFAYLYYHHPGETDYMISELPTPEIELVQFFNERALQWTRFTDARLTFGQIDDLLKTLKPRLIAPAHGGLIDERIEELADLFKNGMAVYQPKPDRASSTAAMETAK